MPEVVIGSDHPALPGHFPGHPVVPAAVILSRVIAMARAEWPELQVTGIRKAKFLNRLGPEDAFHIDLGTPAEDTVKFSCRTGDHVLVQGRLTVRARAPAA